MIVVVNKCVYILVMHPGWMEAISHLFPQCLEAVETLYFFKKRVEYDSRGIVAR
jgi:hypothetical protein